MYISKVSLVNYKNFKNSFFLFNKGINTIIGENGSGKTNLFRAIRLLLDDDLLKSAYKLDEGDFNRSIGSWKGQWIIISLEFSELSPEESIQSLFIHGTGNGNNEVIDKATYNLFFRPKPEIRLKLSELEGGDHAGLKAILDDIAIEDYESFFTGKSTADFNDENVYKELVGDFENVKFEFHLNGLLFGTKIPHQLSISHDICFTFVKALRDVVADFSNNRTNPLITLLKNKSDEINEADYQPISAAVKSLNKSIENLPDVQEIRRNIKETIKEAVGETYSPSSLSIKSSLPDEADKLLQSLKLFIGEPDEDYEGGIHELSLGGANLIFLTLKLLEFKYQKSKETFANFLLIEEPEAHIHTHIQKTLFDRIVYGDTQIIYSTHSTFVSEASNIENINILSKKRNLAEVYQPTIGLLPEKVIKLQRYLDAVRSNLLFAKGVILIEGDAEEILIPLMVKKVFGISLDELGISLINIGSTGFENVAQLFHADRLQRKCSIITDLDAEICDTTELPGDEEDLKKYKKKVLGSHKSGAERKVKLDLFTDGNNWLKPCYAQHTFEVDFILAGNVPEAVSTIKDVYTDPLTRTQATTDLESGDLAVFGRRILRMAKQHGKGWYAILLGGYVNFTTVIPDYIIDAIVFAKSTLNDETVINILKYRIKQYEESDLSPDFTALNEAIEHYEIGVYELSDLITAIHNVISHDQIITFLQKL
jgi:putative ATP-dependent endonuclease of OLD family